MSLQVLETKPLLKEALQAEVGLPIDPSTPLIGFIGRLEEQKGSDILAGAVGDIVKAGAQLVVLVSLSLCFLGTLFLSCPLYFMIMSLVSLSREILHFTLPISIFSGAARVRKATSSSHVFYMSSKQSLSEFLVCPD
jgi:hypothetical protein